MSNGLQKGKQPAEDGSKKDMEKRSTVQKDPHEIDDDDDDEGDDSDDQILLAEMQLSLRQAILRQRKERKQSKH
ncbi:hypothetical protein LZ32DRAFT_601909 [Colletotrichum eremochloae]|nr:hypothetical protein LZ32DRAFT_601909 [Colletotrichum eremochloae]